jgi:uncharacterized metal-binding protein YceD (DUF177 family)
MRRDYIIPFVQLKTGEHFYEYRVEKSFFDLREKGLIANGNVDVLLSFYKSDNLFTLNFKWKGYIDCQCDNCLDEIQYPVEGKTTVTVKIQDEPEEDDIDLMYLGRNAQELDLYEMIYDFIYLDLPMRRLCQGSINGDKKCNTDVIGFIAESEEENIVDPRWDKLKNLFKK